MVGRVLYVGEQASKQVVKICMGSIWSYIVATMDEVGEAKVREHGQLSPSISGHQTCGYARTRNFSWAVMCAFPKKSAFDRHPDEASYMRTAQLNIFPSRLLGTLQSLCHFRYNPTDRIILETSSAGTANDSRIVTQQNTKHTGTTRTILTHIVRVSYPHLLNTKWHTHRSSLRRQARPPTGIRKKTKKSLIRRLYRCGFLVEMSNCAISKHPVDARRWWLEHSSVASFIICSR